MTEQELKECIAEVEHSDIPEPAKEKIMNVLRAHGRNDAWIPCSERLPEYDSEAEYYTPVNVTLDNGRVAEGCYRNLEGQWWVDAEDKGLLLRLPCKVGDKVWDNDFGMPCSYEVTGFSYKNLNEDDNDDDYEDEIVVHYKNFNGSITGRFAASEIGKTVFLTKEQAEQALAEMKIN